MMVYGVAFRFDGGRGASAYVAPGILLGSELMVGEVWRYDDSTDLADMIVGSMGPWALDFPFALTEAAYPAFELRNWQGLLQFAEMYEKSEVEEYLRLAGLQSSEGACRRPGSGCRLTDALTGAYSPLMRGRPDRLGMTYEGLKMLGYLRRRGVPVYPFDEPGPGRERVYEVNPSHTRTWVGMEERTGIRDFTEAFNSLEGRTFKLLVPPDMRLHTHSLDAVVASATLANAFRAFDLDNQWDAMPANVTAREWEARLKEGLIVRL
jgi:hypothetical protein